MMLKKSELDLRDLWDTMKYINICINGSTRSKGKTERGRKFIWRNNAPNFSNLMKSINPHFLYMLSSFYII